jgi:hypothetical protein
MLTRATVAGTAIAVAAGGVLTGSAAQAAPTSVTQVRQADLIEPSGTADGGVQEFLAQGVHLKTTNGSGFARGTFKVGVPLSQATKVDFTWYGTEFSPGIKYHIDADADGKVDGELRGEDTYGGQDVWLNADTQAGSTLPANFFADHAPCTGTTPAPGATGPCGSSGASKHGTLADWAKLLQAATGKAPEVLNGGWSLTGAAGDGVLTQITYGPNQYVFTNLAKAEVTVQAAAKRTKIHKANKARIRGHVEPAAAGAKIALEGKKAGKWMVLKRRDLAASGDYRFGSRPLKMGVNRFRVTVTGTSATQAAKSPTVKVLVVKKRFHK